MQIKMLKAIFLCFIFLFLVVRPLKVYSEIPEDVRIKDSDLNLESADLLLDHIESALKDYRDFTDLILTNEALDKLKDKKVATVIMKSNDLKKFKTINWSIQNIGFTNWLIVVRGTLLKSDYLTKKYEYELAKCQKNLSEKQLSKLQKAMKDAFLKYRNFLDHVSYID